MIPSRLTLALLLGWIALGIAVAFWPLRDLWMAAGGLLAFALLVDGVAGLRTRAPELVRQVAPAISMGVQSPVRLVLENRSRRRLGGRLFDHHPANLATDELPLEVSLPPGEGLRLGYRVKPSRRGSAEFGAADFRCDSPLRLFERKLRIGAPEQVRVYPNFEAVRRYELFATDNRISQLGIRRRPRRGAGLEFHQLREYRPGDPLRQVDWKATSRLQRAISREFQDERDQQIFFVLDCGRRMRATEGGQSHLDAALDAALLVAHVALRQGDAVGLGTQGGPDRWLAPRKGPGHLSALLGAVYDIDSQPRASDFLATANQLLKRVRKRSLIVWISNLRDEDGRELASALKLLRRQHLVLLASLRETELEASLRLPVRDLDQALRVAATHQYLKERDRAHSALETNGALIVDTTPRKLPVALVNGYLDVKASGLL